jgi:penicillin-binding protein 1C
LLRAALATYSGGQRQGGSTWSMQLARRLWDLNTRQVPGKLQQIALAVWLEARYSSTTSLRPT